MKFPSGQDIRQWADGATTDADREWRRGVVARLGYLQELLLVAQDVSDMLGSTDLWGYGEAVALRELLERIGGEL